MVFHFTQWRNIQRGSISLHSTEFRAEQELIHTICCSSLLESKMSLSDCLSVAKNIGSLQSELITQCFTLPDLLTVDIANMALLISVRHNGSIDCTDL